MLSYIKFIFSLLYAFFKRFNLVLILGILFGVMLFLFLRVLVIKLYPTNVTYIGVVGKYRTDELPQYILSKLSEGLTKTDEHGVPTPAIAKSWSSDKTGKTWTFVIDTTKKWQDGTYIKSSDLQYNFDDVTIDRPDNQTLVFNLTSAYAPFPSVLSRPLFKKGLLGTSDWSISKISQLGSYVEKLELVDKADEHLVYRFYPSEEDAKIGFELGQVDKLNDITDLKPFDEWKTVNISGKVDELRYVAVFFNNQEGIFKDNKTLRQALAYAIKKDTWAEQRAISPVPDKSWAFNSQVKPYEYDVERSKELLKTILKKDQRVSIKLSTVSNLVSVADNIAKDWDSVGVGTDVSVVSEIPQSFDALLVEYDVSLDPDQYLTWHSTQTETNISRYANPRIDKLLEDGRLEMNGEDRKKIYLDFQRFLLEDVPAVFLYHPNTYDIVRK